ncbi:MAG: hypothetical protein K0S41_2966 [Anaerocolumna sp.]|jgi:hypothetical protein|nr:hypothetical protein [Anaerocolumna sp.]
MYHTLPYSSIERICYNLFFYVLQNNSRLIQVKTIHKGYKPSGFIRYIDIYENKIKKRCIMNISRFKSLIFINTSLLSNSIIYIIYDCLQ